MKLHGVAQWFLHLLRLQEHKADPVESQISPQRPDWTSVPDLQALNELLTYERADQYPMVHFVFRFPEEGIYLGLTELHRAAALGDLAEVRRHLEMSSDIDAIAAPARLSPAVVSNGVLEYALTPLFVAAIRGQTAVVKYLADEGAVFQLCRYSRGTVGPSNRIATTALIVAARADRPAVVALLLQEGVGVDVRDEHGATALVWAAFDGHLEVVKLLLAAGADINARLRHCGAGHRRRAFYNATALFLATDQCLKNPRGFDQSTGHLKTVSQNRWHDVVEYLTAMGAEHVGECG